MLDPYELTDRQKDILDFLAVHQRVRQRPPTIREIGDKFGIMSPNGVLTHLKALEKKGAIVRNGFSRGIEIIGVTDPVVAKLREAAAFLESIGNATSNQSCLAKADELRQFLEVTPCVIPQT